MILFCFFSSVISFLGWIDLFVVAMISKMTSKVFRWVNEVTIIKRPMNPSTDYCFVDLNSLGAIPNKIVVTLLLEDCCTRALKILLNCRTELLIYMRLPSKNLSRKAIRIKRSIQKSNLDKRVYSRRLLKWKGLPNVTFFS